MNRRPRTRVLPAPNVALLAIGLILLSILVILPR
jgi:hypothetical protein